jgi:2-polyprenyl-6-hydroxyphenyl methylase/3-demethylubiquinone-9 3-methyltransferase
LTDTAASQTSNPNAGSVDTDEVARFGNLSRDWWNPTGSMRALHQINPLRIRYVRDLLYGKIGASPKDPSPLSDASILDVGCGAGLLAEPLARLGATVTAIDASSEMIQAAESHADGTATFVNYSATTAEDLATSGETFDAVLVMELVEHVSDVDSLMTACCHLVRPGGVMVVATLNRTVRSLVFGVGAAEYILGWAPRGTHDWRKFLRPSELGAHIRAGGLTVTDLTGIAYSPITREWKLSRDVAINYMVTAKKPGDD